MVSYTLLFVITHFIRRFTQAGFHNGFFYFLFLSVIILEEGRHTCGTLNGMMEVLVV